jgi:hypothetical protein
VHAIVFGCIVSVGSTVEAEGNPACVRHCGGLSCGVWFQHLASWFSNRPLNFCSLVCCCCLLSSLPAAVTSLLLLLLCPHSCRCC